MALLAVLLPLLMLGVVLALGRYEDLLLPKDPDEADRPVPKARRTTKSNERSGSSRPGNIVGAAPKPSP